MPPPPLHHLPPPQDHHLRPSLPLPHRIGVTYTPSSTSPPPESISAALHHHQITTVRLLNPSPATIRAFSYTNISLLLSLPNSLLPSFSSNLSAPTQYLSTHVLPFYPRAKIHLISLGNDVITSPLSSSSVNSNSVDCHTVDSNAVDFDPTTTLIPALRNLHLALHNLGIRTILVSTTLNILSILTTSFPPSRAEFQDPIGNLTIKPLLSFLDETNSCFLVNVYPYNVYKMNSEIPMGFALFEEHPFNFRDDGITGARYMSLYDMMVDSVIAAMAVMGYENIPVIVAETGWPSSSGGGKNGNRSGEAEVEMEASLVYAEMYLKGLIKHSKSRRGTPLRKEGAAEAYIYQLFDGVEGNGKGQEQNWGIMYNNMSMKYNIDLSAADGRFGWNGFWLVIVFLLI
ncbi:hypothetical protein Leryth_007444 [Lithospermum erythrorhizon]|nr:hypothetical protein Leryth_007444 [Lithospermum erythrorhizon]